MGRRANLAIHGAVAGGLAAACMTVFRMVAHRAGWISQMVPQAAEVWTQEHLDLDLPETAAGHHVADQLMHIAYGAAWGAFHAALIGRRSPPNAARALELGLPLWAFGSMVLFPALEIGRPAWRSSPSELVVNLTAHLLYGAVTVFVTEELENQELTQPRVYALSREAPVG
jgi:hypothetical protein